MQIDVREAAELFAVSEKTIYRWIKAGSLPGYRVQGQYRFNREELLEWATSRSIPIDPVLFEEPPAEGSDTPAAALALAPALKLGGIHRGVRGDGKAEVLAAVVELIPLPRSSTTSSCSRTGAWVFTTRGTRSRSSTTRSPR